MKIRPRIWFIIMCGVATVSLAGCCETPELSSVQLRLFPQHRDSWCWAASTEMVSEFYGHRVPQCESVNFVHGTPPDCCTGCTGNCPCWGRQWAADLVSIENNFTHWNFEYTSTASSLSWSELKTAIYCRKSPAYAIWLWKCPTPPCGGHAVVVYGYVQAGGQDFVAYFDPWPPDCDNSSGTCNPTSGGDDLVSTYAAFEENGVHVWGHTLYNFSYSGD